jgi:hypothetical protein
MDHENMHDTAMVCHGREVRKGRITEAFYVAEKFHEDTVRMFKEAIHA